MAVVTDETLQALQLTLDEIIQQNEKMRKDEKDINVKVEGNEDMIILLSGLSAISQEKKIQDIGQQVKMLADSISMLSKIDRKAIQGVAEDIKMLANTFGEIKIEKRSIQSVSSIAQVLAATAQINADSGLALHRLAQFIVPEDAIRLSDFVNHIEITNPKERLAQTKVIAMLFNGLSQIDIIKLQTQLNALDPSTAQKLGDFLGNIVNAISKSVGSTDKEQIEKLEPLAKFIGSLGNILEVFQKGITIKYNPIKGKLYGMAIGLYFKELVNGFIGMSQEAIETMQKVMTTDEAAFKNFTAIMQCIFAVDPKKLQELSKALKKIDVSSTQNLAQFVNNLINGIPEKSQARAIAFLQLINAINNISLLGFVKLVIVGKIVSPDSGTKIAQFIDGLLSFQADPKKGEMLATLTLSISKAVLIGAATAGVLAAIVAIGGVGNALVGLGILITIITAMTVASIVLAKAEAQIQSGVNVIGELGHGVFLMAATVALISLTFTIFPNAIMATAALIAITATLVIAVKFVASSLQDIQNGGAAIKELAVSIAIVTVAVGLLALLSATGKLTGAIIALAAIGVIFVGIVWISSIANIFMKEKMGENLVLLSAAITLLIFDVGLLILLADLAMQYDTEVLMRPVLMLAAVSLIVLVLGIFMRDNGESIMFATIGMSVILLAVCYSMKIVAEMLTLYDQQMIEDGMNMVLWTVAKMAIMVVLMSLLIDNESGQAILLSLIGISAALAIVSLVVKELIIPIGYEKDAADLGIEAVMGVMWGLTGIVVIVSLINMLLGLGKGPGINIFGIPINMGFAVKNPITTMVILTAILLAVSLITMHLLIPIGRRFGNAMLGIGAVILIMVGLTAMTAYLHNIFKNQVEMNQALLTIGAITLVLLAVSLITSELLIPIGHEFTAALGGIVAVALIVAGMAYAIKKINEIFSGNPKTGQKPINAMTLLKNVGVMVLTLAAFALITKFILIPIGNEWKAAAIGAIVVIALTTVMVFVMEKINSIKKNTIEGARDKIINIAIALGAMSLATAAFIAVCAEINYFFPLNGEQWVSSLISIAGAGLIIAAIILATVGAVNATAQLDKGKMTQGAIVLGMMSGVLLAVSIAAGAFMCVAKMVEGTDGAAIAITGVIVAAMFIAIGVMMYALSSFAMGPQAIALAIGAAVMVAMAGVMILITLAIDNFISIIEAASKLNNDDIVQAGITFAAMIVFLSTTVIAMAGLTPLAVMASVTSVALMPVFAAISKFIDIVCKLANFQYITSYDSEGKPVYGKMPPTAFADAAKVITEGFTTFLKGLADAFNSFGAWTLVVIAFMNDKLKPMVEVLGKFVDIVIKVATMQYVEKYDDKGHPVFKRLEPSVFGQAATVVVNGFTDFLKGLADGMAPFEKISWSTVMMLTNSMNTIMRAVGKFVDIVIKVATMQYVESFDAKGNPVYKRLEPEVFAQAASIVTNGFSDFLHVLVDAFTDLEKVGAFAVKLIAKSLIPVMEAVGKFVDIVIKVATMQYVESFDKNGHPVLKKLDPSVFAQAASVVTSGFSDFLNMVNKGFSEMQPRSLAAVQYLGNSLKPVLECVGMFVQTIGQVAAASYVKGFDKDGHPILEKLDPSEFAKAGNTIMSLLFGDDNNKGFITTMLEKFDAPGNDNVMFRTTRLIKLFGDSIMPVINSIGKFIDIILKVATSQYPIEFDKNGKPTKFQKLSKEDFENAGTTINELFNTFITNLIEKMKTSKEDSIDAIELLGKSVMPVIEAVDKFMDIVIKMSTLQFIESYDSNGKPIYHKVTPDEFKLAGEKTAETFNYFVKELIDRFGSMNKSSAKAITRLGESMIPVVSALAQFIDVIIKMSTLQIASEFDKDGKPIAYTHITPDEVNTAAKNITSTFITFIESIRTSLSNINEKQSAAIKAVGEAMIPIMQALSQFVDTIIKVATLQIVTGYDKEGRPIMGEIKGHSIKLNSDGSISTGGDVTGYEAIAAAGSAISVIFISFLQNMANKLNEDNVKDKLQSALNALKDGITPVMQGFSLFINAICQLATLQVLKETKPDGTQIFEHVPADQIVKAVDPIITVLIKFLDEIKKNFAKDSLFGNSAKDAIDALAGGIQPIMDGFMNFTNAIIEFSKVYSDDQKDKFNNAADTLALMFTSFVTNLAKQINADGVKKQLAEAQEGLTMATAIAGNVLQIIDKMVKAMQDTVDGTKFETLESGLITYLEKALNRIITHISENAQKYEDKATQSAKIMESVVRSFLSVANAIVTAMNTTLNKVDYNAIDITTTHIINIIKKIVSINDTEYETDNVNKLLEYINVVRLCVDALVAISVIAKANPDLDDNMLYIVGAIDKVAGLANKKDKIGQATTGLNAYTAALKKWAAEMKTDTKIIKGFTGDITNLTKALTALDNELIKKSDARQKALKTFTTGVQELGEQMKKMEESVTKMLAEDTYERWVQLVDKMTEYQDRKAEMEREKARAEAEPKEPGKGNGTEPRGTAGGNTQLNKLMDNLNKTLEDLNKMLKTQRTIKVHIDTAKSNSNGISLSGNTIIFGN